MTTTANIILVRARGGRETVLFIKSTDDTRIEAVGLNDATKSLWQLLDGLVIEAIWWIVGDGSIATLVDVTNTTDNALELDCQCGEEVAQYDAKRTLLDKLMIKVRKGHAIFVTTTD